VSASLELELPAAADCLPGARRELTEFCDLVGLDGDVAERVRIAVNEACANCVRHAYRDAEAGCTYMLETRVEDDALLVVVHDCGIGIALPSVNGGMGFGFRIIEELADGIDVSSRAGFGTRVAMRFATRSAA
jgi:serine/threonine-protein kinase RsbW